jgi:hypothetical protein
MFAHAGPTVICRAANLESNGSLQPVASDALDAAVKIVFVSAFKTASQGARYCERGVPLHPAVIEAGFLRFVSKSAAGPLFSTLPPDVFGNRGGNATKIIGRWVRGLGLTDARISPSHSWRHRFKTLGRRHGLMPDIVNAITGHHRKTVADSYGEFPVDALYREIAKIPAVPLE